MGENIFEKPCSVFSVSFCSASAKNFNFGASLFQNSTDLTLESVQEDVGTFPCPTKSLKESTIPKLLINECNQTKFTSMWWWSYLQHRSSTQDGSFHAACVTLLAESRQAVNEEVSALRFAWSALSWDNDTLVDVLAQHGVVGYIGNGENMRLQLAQLVVLVHFDIFGVVNG